MKHILHFATNLINSGIFPVVFISGGGRYPSASAPKAVLFDRCYKHMMVSAYWTPPIKNSWIGP